ncbi:MAG: MFS transporter [Ktedonobacterales bacterium]
MANTVTQRIRFTRALQSRPFALLWIGQTISSLGNGAYITALAWTVLLLTGSATAMGVVLIARTVPMLIFLLIGGVAADRLPRRLVLIVSDSGSAIAVLAVAVLLGLHRLALWELVALAFFNGVVSGFFRPAYQSIAPELVEKEALPSANGLNGLTMQLATLLGPLIGAGLVALSGPQGAFAFDGLSFVISVGFLLAIRLPESVSSQRAPEHSGPAASRGVRGVVFDVHAGLRYILGSSWLWVTIVLASLYNVALGGALTIALPKLVRNVYHADVSLFGLITAMSGVGAIVAMLVIGQLRHLRHRGWLAYLGFVMSSVALLAYGLPLPVMILPAVAVAASFVNGLGIGVFGIIWDTVLQELVPADKLGRVSSVEMLGSFALLPVGYGVIGVLTDRVGAAFVFLAAGTLALLLSLAGLSVRGIRELE